MKPLLISAAALPAVLLGAAGGWALGRGDDRSIKLAAIAGTSALQTHADIASWEKTLGELRETSAKLDGEIAALRERSENAEAIRRSIEAAADLLPETAASLDGLLARHNAAGAVEALTAWKTAVEDRLSGLENLASFDPVLGEELASVKESMDAAATSFEQGSRDNASLDARRAALEKLEAAIAAAGEFSTKAAAALKAREAEIESSIDLLKKEYDALPSVP